MTLTDKLFVLRRTPPFDRLWPDEAALLADVARLRRYAPGEVVVAAGVPMAQLHILASGAVCRADGVPVGRVFGVSGLLFERGCRAELRAGDEGASCLTIAKAHFLTMIHECPTFLGGLLAAAEAGSEEWI